ncbi:hypothetical protein FKW77_009019 [Venturia effusa]|uniref:DUF726-domain-containing protein n=1 Tax=Venturia effusa TaxID=50376 RepID=A0A517LEG4_9PEZI|nr:hypothetical protein FKW77_009019 [Venturia effusa]
MVLNPFKARGGESSKPSSNQEQSLTTVLSTKAQRADLTLLLASCTSAMRKTITDTFDPRYSGAPSDSRYDNSTKNQKVDLAKSDLKELQERQEAKKRIKELSDEEMQALKKAALDFFDKWRDGVLGRVGEVVDSREEATRQGEVKKGKEVERKSPDTTTKKLRPEDVKAEVTKEKDTVTNALEAVYPPIKTPLLALKEEERKLILHSVMLLVLSLENYAAHSRVLLLYLANSLDIHVDFLVEDENVVAHGLLEAAESMNADDEKRKKAEENTSSRKWKVGLVTVAGAALIGVTGGLATPLVAAGFGTVMGALGLAETAAALYLGSLAGSSLLVGSLFGAYGGKMTGKIMDKYAKEVEDFAFLPIHKWSRTRKIGKEYRRLRVAIGISGWLTDKEEVVKPWRVLSPSIEGFALRYEVESLLSLGNAMTSLATSAAFNYAKKEILKRTIKRTVYSALQEAMWPLMILKVAKIVDNPFSYAKSRSDKAGELMADALINKVQGERPVTLIGFSLGARVIYTCLMSLAKRKAFGLIENVVLLGCPAPSDSSDWRKMRSVVSGRLVNVYSENDYILAFLYRTSSIQYGVAGLRSIEYVKGVENFDVSDIVSGHLRYRYLTGAILKRIGCEDIDIKEVEQEEAELKEVAEMEEREAKQNLEKYEKGKITDEQELEIMEEEVKKKNEQSTMDWASAKFQRGKESAADFFGGWGKKDSVEAQKQDPDETQKKNPGEAQKKAPGEAQKKDSSEAQRKDPGKARKEDSIETQNKDPVKAQKKNAVERQKNDPGEARKKDSAEMRNKDPVERQNKDLAERQKNDPIEMQNKDPVEAQRENPVERQRENPVERQRENPVERQRENPVERQRENPVERHRENPVERQRNDPAERQKNDPVQRQKKDPVEPQKKDEASCLRLRRDPIETQPKGEKSRFRLRRDPDEPQQKSDKPSRLRLKSYPVEEPKKDGPSRLRLRSYP